MTTHPQDDLLRRFEAHRAHLLAVAYRMLGSVNEAEDAVQEAWLRLGRSETDSIANLGGWLTTVVGRVCLDMLRARRARRETPEARATLPVRESETDPERDLVLADSIGLALLAVLDALAPPERLAFVLHDMFGMSFEEIAPAIGRSVPAAKQLASRARRRFRGAEAPDGSRLQRERETVRAFLVAARSGDLAALVAVLDPEATVTAGSVVVRGRSQVAKQALLFSHGTARFTSLARVAGGVGLVVAPYGRMTTVLSLKVVGDQITAIEVHGDPAHFDALELALLDDWRQPC